jgi:choline dehydrogenase-like flavoprotein
MISPRHRKVLLSLAEAAMPATARLEAGGPRTVKSFERLIATFPAPAARGLLAAYLVLEASTIPIRGRPFSSLALEARAEVLAGMEQSRLYAVRTLLRALLTPLKQAHFDEPSMYAHVGCHHELPAVRDEEPRWLAQVTDGAGIEDDMDLACEVVVIGTGAGGAAAAYELASRGRAVLLLEEGAYHRRSSFRGSVGRAHELFYRDQGLTIALGNVGIPVFAGRMVGGSTAINSGTCYRTPERTFALWRERFGLGAEFSSSGLAPYYERVEAMLQVAPASPLQLGEIGPIIARGAEHLGLRHGPLNRNAPDCDGQGVCCFGCPTGAKRSTDVSYVPEALKRGAQLVTGARVDTVDLVAGRARGVTATIGRARPGHDGGKSRPKLRVHAEAVVVAGGALMTPLLLGRSRIGRRPSLGKNLSIHPASKVMALFDRPVEQWRGIPQGYTIDHYADEGLMFEGGSLPFGTAALGVPWTGRRFMELMDRYPYLATFGFMIQDTSRGEVRPGAGGSPLILYSLNERDVRQMQRGFEILCAVYQAAGARRVLPLIAGHDEATTPAELDRLKASRVRPGDLEVAGFHPLGTCRIGEDDAACLGPDHQVRDAPGVYVCDGSAVPSSLGVNPQMTIMAMALRAAEGIDAALS